MTINRYVVYLSVFIFISFVGISVTMIYAHPRQIALQPAAKKIDSADMLETSLKHDIQESINKGEIESGSVYTKDLTNSKVEISINFQFKYTPASLLKVPLAMSIYKLSQEDSDLLQKKLLYNEDLATINTIQLFEPEVKLAQGEQYTVEELVKRMLVYSDNASMRLLLTQVDEQSFIDVYNKQGVPLPSPDTTDNYMIAKDYVSFFDSLYTASYINKENSDKILDLLSRTTFEKGLAMGVPPRIRIAHKFGERELDGSNLTQLHDCGIVYAEKSPYIICVMLKGETFPNEENLIGKISERIYTYMSLKSRAH